MRGANPTAKMDRRYLEGLIDQYLEAVVAHDPARLPLAKTVKFTENAQVIPIGEALWATASANATYRLYACDPAAGQVGFFGLMEENHSPIIVSIRLKIEHGLITEIETVVVRQQGERTIPVQNLIKPNPVYLDPLKASERVSREEMIRIADLYFDGLVQDNGDIIPFDDECNRIENGNQTTNNPDLDMPGMGLDCRQQISAKTFAGITAIHPRRYTVIDQERGLTFGTFMFHHNGIIIPGVMTAEKRGRLPPPRPFTAVISELFKIRNGKIRQIEAIMMSLPYGAKSGWDDQAGTAAPYITK
jgi:hypothetical protein